LAFEGSEHSDFVAGLDIATDGARRFILDSVHARLDFTGTIAVMEQFRAQHRDVSGIFVENRANGAAAINTLSQKIPGISKVDPSRSKADRAYAASDELNAGNWYLPHPQLAPWVDAFLFELGAFPRGKHDDWVDAWSQAAQQLRCSVDYSMFTRELRVPEPGLPPRAWWET
jgi:predicted phage terminase large subunit-like protein